eukprot:scaffold299_cov343-Prasinococcus_capsulatus_cf.AAC.12
MLLSGMWCACMVRAAAPTRLAEQQGFVADSERAAVAATTGSSDRHGVLSLRGGRRAARHADDNWPWLCGGPLGRLHPLYSDLRRAAPHERRQAALGGCTALPR